MDEIKKNTNRKTIKKTILFLTIFILQIAQAYWSMSYLKNEISAHCIDCSFISGIVFFSLFHTLLIGILYALFNKIAFLKKHIIIILSFLILMAFYSQNHDIYIERYASWTTITHFIEFLDVWYISGWKIGVSTILFYFLSVKIIKITS